MNAPSQAATRHSDARQSGRTTDIRVDAFRDSFPSVVRALGGRPEQMLAAEGLSADLLSQPDGVLKYRTMIDLFERASVELNCPDFGLRLARSTADGLTVLGPLEVAMRNSLTLRDALNFCSRYVHVYTAAIHISLERDDRLRRDYMLWDLMLDGIPCQRQVVEHALGLAFSAIKALSGGQARPSEIWFTHGRKASLDCYREHFGIPVRFGMPYNALYFGEAVLDCPIANRNPQVYEMAVSYIDLQFPLSTVLLTSQVRVILARLLAANRCTQAVVAEMMAMHPRTFQRRLREEGTTFEAIVNLVRREIALRNLFDGSASLVQIAEKLGYSETSVLTRSCHRWFALSPRQMRKVAESGSDGLVSWTGAENRTSTGSVCQPALAQRVDA
jgi:AraC-like DNA-binding protein